ncbi:hypothetical protein HHK36_009367 [Tetracentron sinense]|uniref:WRKY domain-containing protein n=1 Tax=Tetracentron sinense TaxID=13715 RepID=A0A834ZL89_TETSI|nr:hypothetical protein HHK36_009367 [Tetracentron sinense]
MKARLPSQNPPPLASCTTMSASSLLAMDLPDFHNPNPNYNYLMENTDQVHFQLSDYLMLDDDASEEDSRSSIIGGCPSQSPITLQKVAGDSVHEHTGATTPRSSHMKCKGGKKMKMDVGFRIAFRTKSELEIMDDGFKWRKYGKKSVKNSSNPR